MKRSTGGTSETSTQKGITNLRDKHLGLELMQRTGRALSFWALAAVLTASSPLRAAPKNVVIVLADGLGEPQYRMAAEYSKTTYQEEFQSADRLRDRPGSSLNGALTLAGILSRAASHGYPTGLVTTEDVVTDACRFYEIKPQTKKPGDADVEEVLKANSQLILGGGLGYFIQQSKPHSLRTDELDMLVEARAAGWKTLTNADELFEAQPGTKLLGLFSDKSLSNALDKDPMKQPSLFEMVDAALNGLGTGFFLIVHDGYVAEACKANDPASMVEEARELDGVIRRVLDFAGEHRDTLVVVAGSPAPQNPVMSAGGDPEENYYAIKSLPVSLTTGAKKAEKIGVDKWIEEHYVNFKLTEEQKKLAEEDPQKTLGIFVEVFGQMTGVSWEKNNTTGVTLWGTGPGWDQLKALSDVASLEESLKSLKP